jgi:PadR family transcriptional regulator PadR
LANPSPTSTPAPPTAVDRWTQQLRKGSTRLAILQLLSEADSYGYHLLATIRDRTAGTLAIAEGNLYPALHTLEAEGHVTSYWRDTDPGTPQRKYYHLTPTGHRHLTHLVHEWNHHTRAITRLLGDPA